MGKPATYSFLMVEHHVCRLFSRVLLGSFMGISAVIMAHAAAEPESIVQEI